MIYETAPAKINLTLDTLYKREDGYHEVEMIMTTIDLNDRLTFECRDDGEIIIDVEHNFVPSDHRNLAYKAAKLMQDRYNIKKGVKISLEKSIPISAGLAGGSSDAAATFRGLNELWGINESLEVSTSNGLGWSPNREFMYYIDTPTRSVDRFDFDLASGTISNRTSIILVPEDMGFPDGMTVDAEGMLWVAHWGGGRVTRWNPETGELLQQIEVPADQVTSCCFGGPDLEDLYITTARIGIKEERLQETPQAGALFVVKPGVKGQETHVYGRKA